MINLKEFQNPSAPYRTAPFWALNGKLEAEELKRQINQFKIQGMGGAFLHPRGGMSTEYLSEDFWQAIEVCIKEMTKQDMVCWLYDEDRFPSGIAGGKVPALNPDYTGKYITKNYEVKQSSISPVYNNESFIDVCNEDAVKDFIRITHDEYYNRFKEYFGNTIQAMFTDEPHLIRTDGLHWTKDFDKRFKEKYDYELKECYKDLFEDTPTAPRTRFHYWSLISSMFVNAFSKTIYDWCEERNIAYTGHFWEHEFPSPTMQGSVMPHYKYMQYPGIDMLFVSDATHPEQYSNDLIVKEVSSVANQFGKKRVLTETNGASGWGLDFAYQKRATDWQLALGINLFCQHLSMYSMEGYRKRDFPLSFLDHQPWWEDYKLLGDYIGRMSYALTCGKYVAETLVLHPSSSTWVVYNDAEKLKRVGDSAQELVKILNQNRVLFDLGDDVIMHEDAYVKDGQLHIKEMAYKVVFMPEMYVLRSSVFKLLQEFSQNGGKIISTGATPTLLDGEPSKELEEFFVNSVTKYDAGVINSLLKIELVEENGKDISQVYGHLRQNGNDRLVFLCNLDMNETYELNMPISQFGGQYFITRLDGVTGEVLELENCKFCLQPLESALFILSEQKIDGTHVCEQPNFTNSIPLANWNIQLKDHNALHLQFCRAALNNEPYGNVMDVLKIDDAFKDRLGLERGHIFARQPWMYSQEEKDNVHSVKAEYPFTISEMPTDPLYMAVESPNIFAVYINGTQVKPTNSFYKDATFPLYEITEHVKLGENTIRIQSDKYGVLVNLESVYVVGNFRLNGTAIHQQTQLLPGNLVDQGCQYYSGRVEYSATVDINGDFAHAKLTFGKFYGVTATVKVNGQKVDTIGWQPYTVNLMGKLAKGKNTISIEIANSLQNLLGPFGEGVNQHLVTPGSFYADKHEVFFPVGFEGVAMVEIG